MELYYEDPYIKEIDANVLEIDDDFIVFDRTIFYPGGGGQPPDSGYYYGQGFRVRILSASNENGIIKHRYKVLEGKPGKSGRMAIDWERRYTLMKMHTGEHILYRALENLFPVKFQKVNFDENGSSLYVSGDIGIDEIRRAEELANEVIGKNLEVKAYFGELDSVGKDVRVRRDRIRVNDIRIVEVEGFDKSACSGLHVKRTAEIGLVFVKSMRKGEFTEIKFLAGDPAWKYVYESAVSARKIYSKFNVDPATIEEKFSAMHGENEILRKSLYEISSSMFQFNSIETKKGKLYYSDYPYADFKGVEKRARKMIESENCTVIYGNETLGRIFILSSENIENIEKILKDLNVKGGGKGNYFMLSVTGNFRDVFEKIIKNFS